MANIYPATPISNLYFLFHILHFTFRTNWNHLTKYTFSVVYAFIVIRNYPKYADPNNDRAVCNQLDAFIIQVDAKMRTGQLENEQGDQLLQAAQSIKGTINCF
jgi:hypothetical protein